MSNIFVQLREDEYRIVACADYLLDDLGLGTVEDFVPEPEGAYPIKPRIEELNTLVDMLIEDAGKDKFFKEEFLDSVVVETEVFKPRKVDKPMAYWAKKLAEQDVRDIKKELKNRYHGQLVDLAWKYGVSDTNIAAIRDGKIFAHV